ncbi:MAG: SDR family oxidoreductase [Burkholderiaceae bacterium]
MLSNKVALVTGGGSGIGQQIALAYARANARVAVADLSAESAEATAAMIAAAGGKAIAMSVDVTDAEDCARMVEQTVGQFGRLDIACNNAGAAGGMAPLAEYPLDLWDKLLAVNLTGVFYCLRQEIPAMLASGDGGAIVNIASVLGMVGMAGTPAYTASKHGVVGLTRVAALDYSAKGVRVNAVGPGFIQTPMIARIENNEPMRAEVESRHPIGRLGKPEEVAELVLWLSSPKASFVTGAYYPVDGGYLTR